MIKYLKLSLLFFILLNGPLSAKELCWKFDRVEFQETDLTFYPGETITYYYDETSKPKTPGIIEHRISFKQRGTNGEVVYTSAYPIFRIHNISDADIQLFDDHQVMPAGEIWQIEQPAIYQLKIFPKDDEGEFLIYSQGVKKRITPNSKVKNPAIQASFSMSEKGNQQTGREFSFCIFHFDHLKNFEQLTEGQYELTWDSLDNYLTSHVHFASFNNDEYQTKAPQASLKAFKALIGNYYVKSPSVENEAWEAVMPYLLPYDHPLKAKLDTLFPTGDIAKNGEKLTEAGFKYTKQQGLHIIAAKHKKLKGYIIKFYGDTLKEKEWQNWVRRVKGSEVVRNGIRSLGYENLFKAPKKWIYPLPECSEPCDKHDQKRNFILIAEDMDLLSAKSNKDKYRHEMSKKTLHRIYTILETLGLGDSARVNNLAWSKDGKLAFVDTENYNKWPVNYHPLQEFLTGPNRTYWSQLIANAKKTKE